MRFLLCDKVACQIFVSTGGPKMSVYPSELEHLGNLASGSVLAELSLQGHAHVLPLDQTIA